MARALRNFQPGKCYHLMSRIAHQEYYLDPEEKNHLVRLIRNVESFTHVRVLAYCVMTNHLHVLVYLPERPAERPPAREILESVAALYGETYASCVKQEWERLEKQQLGLSDAEQESYFARMYDVSEFMKSIKQRYSMSFNYENEHFGTMWEGRFKAVHVQATRGPMSAVAAYDDLNPIRAGIVKDLVEYPWCSWHAAMRGDERAMDGYRFIYGMAGEKWDYVALRHLEVMRDKAGYFARASRSFIEGGAIGDESFVRQYAKDYLPPNRKIGPQKLAGGLVWGGLRVARDVRVKIERVGPFEGHDVVLGKGSDPMPEGRDAMMAAEGRRMLEEARAAGVGRNGWLELKVAGKGSDPMPESGGVAGRGSDPMPEGGSYDGD